MKGMMSSKSDVTHRKLFELFHFSHCNSVRSTIVSFFLIGIHKIMLYNISI